VWGEHESFVIELITATTEQRLWLSVVWLATGVVALVIAIARLRARPLGVADLENNGRLDQRRKPLELAPMSPLSIALGLDPTRKGELGMGDKIPPSELVGLNGVTTRL